MLNIESKLLEDSDGTHLRELQNEFNDVAMQAKQTVYQGVPPDQFKALQALEKSAETAAQIVGKIWDRFHQVQ